MPSNFKRCNYISPTSLLKFRASKIITVLRLGIAKETKYTFRTGTSHVHIILHYSDKTVLRGLSLRANHTIRRLSAKLVPTFADGGCYMVSVMDPYGCILRFLDRSCYFFLHVAPHLYSRGWMDPVLDPLLRKFRSEGNRTRTPASVARNSDHRSVILLNLMLILFNEAVFQILRSFILLLKLITCKINIVAFCTWLIIHYCNRKTMFYASLKYKLWVKLWGWIQMSLMETEFSFKFIHFQIYSSQCRYISARGCGLKRLVRNFLMVGMSDVKVI
jgi:hypothetical protein